MSPFAVRWFFWLFCLLTLSGCAARLPQTVALTGSDLEAAEHRLNTFLAQSCFWYVDSDVRLQWQAYGRRETYPATLLAASPASLRLSVVDPLGRPQLLLAVRGNTFTLADNRSATGYTGRLDSDFVHAYLPGAISGDNLFSWLSGRIARQGMQVLSSRGAEDGALYWYELDYGERLIHLVGLDSFNLRRHLVLNKDGSFLFEVQYSNYGAVSETCGWPGKIVVTGEELSGDFSLEFTRLYSFSPLEQHLFQLTLPPHFTVQEVR